MSTIADAIHALTRSVRFKEWCLLRWCQRGAPREAIHRLAAEIAELNRRIADLTEKIETASQPNNQPQQPKQ